MYKERERKKRQTDRQAGRQTDRQTQKKASSLKLIPYRYENPPPWIRL